MSKDGRLQIVVVRTRFPSGEVSRNAPASRPSRRAVDEARRIGGAGVRIGITGDVVNNAAEHRALLGGMLRATVFTVVIVALGMLLFFASTAAVAALLGALALGALVDVRVRAPGVGHLNLATAFLAPIVVGNGINFGIILLARYFEERRKTDRSGGGAGRGRAGQPGRHAGGRADGVGLVRVAARDRFPRLPALRPDRRRRDPVLLGRDVPGPAGRARGARGARRCAGRALAGAPRQRPRAAGAAPPAGHRADRAGRGGRVGRRRRASTWRASPFENDFKNLRSSGPEMRETRRWNESIDRAFGRGISGGTVIALPTRERAREVAERMRAADRGQARGASACSRASRRWTTWCRPTRTTSSRCWPTSAGC